MGHTGTKPEAGQWWDSNSVGRFCVLGKMNNGFWAIDDNSDEPDLVADEFFRKSIYLPQCTGFDWKQPAEDPDEWVEITDLEHVLRCDVDHTYNDYGLWEPISAWHGETIGEMHELGCRNKFRCRRRDLPKVEPAGQALSNTELKAVCDDVMRWQKEQGEPQQKKTRVRLWARPDGASS